MKKYIINPKKILISFVAILTLYFLYGSFLVIGYTYYDHQYERLLTNSHHPLLDAYYKHLHAHWLAAEHETCGKCIPLYGEIKMHGRQNHLIYLGLDKQLSHSFKKVRALRHDKERYELAATQHYRFYISDGFKYNLVKKIDRFIYRSFRSMALSKNKTLARWGKTLFLEYETIELEEYFY